MKKSQKILVGVGAGVLALAAVTAIAGPLIYKNLAESQTVAAPELGATTDLLETTADGSALDATVLAGDWTVAEGSEAGYRVDEVLNGTNVTVTGRTTDVTGQFTISDTGTVLEAAELSVNVASISTDSSSRDSYFRDQALRTSEFPTATFVLTSPVTLDALPESGVTVETQATGDLTLAGVTQSITFDVAVRSDGTTAEIAGAIPITFADFGVTAPSLGFVQVEDTGFVEFQLTASH